MSPRETDSDDVEEGRAPGRGLAIVTLLVALYAATAGTIAMTRKPATSVEGGRTSVPMTPADREAFVAAEAGRIRTEVQEDLQKAVDQAKQQCAAATQQALQAGKDLQKAFEDATKRVDEIAKSTHGRVDVIEDKANTLTKDFEGTKATVDSLATAVKELEKRPAVVEAAPPTNPNPAPVPGGLGPKALDGVAPDAPKGPTPEEIAAQKEKVKKAIADLAGTDGGKLWAAAELLGKAGDLEAVEPLVKVLKDNKDPYMRLAAAGALGNLHACDAVPALIEAFGDKDGSVCAQAGQAWQTITGEDSGLSASANRKEKNEAKEKAKKWWSSNEAAARKKWNQSKAEGGG